MATIYYKVETTWCAYPFQDEVDEKMLISIIERKEGIY